MGAILPVAGRKSVRSTWRKSVTWSVNLRTNFYQATRQGYLRPFAEKYNILKISILYVNTKSTLWCAIKMLKIK